MLEQIASFLRIRVGLRLRRRKASQQALLDLTARYLADPVATAGLDPRSVAKLDRAFGRTQATLGWPRPEAIDYILATAARRMQEGRPTLYINNIGSSGSHWLMAMLREGVDLFGMGEIYVPRPFLYRQIDPLEFPQRAVFLQSVYLAHLMTGTAADAEISLSNTAHLPDLAVYTRNDLPSRKVLLIRDPVEIVLSRTLRKPAFRRYLGREATDDASYLRENIARVGRFYRKIEPEGYDLVVRYEDLLADPVPVLAAIARRLDAQVDPVRLLQAAERSRRDAGPEAAPEALRETARRALEDVCRKFAYG